MKDHDPFQFLEKYLKQDNTRFEKKNRDLNLQEIEENTREITPVLHLLLDYVYAPEEFPSIILQIKKTLESFGVERIKQYYFLLQNEIISGRIEYLDLSPNIQKFMSGTYYCFERLAEHFPETWKPELKDFYQISDAQIVREHRDTIIQLYTQVVAELNNPPIPQNVKETLLLEILNTLESELGSYKLRSQERYEQRYSRVIKYLQTRLVPYLKMLLQ